MNYILFDSPTRNYLLPLTFTRPTCDIRIGILTIREKWEKYLESKTSTYTEDYLRVKFPVIIEDKNILINGTVLPNQELVKQINNLKPNEALISDDITIAICIEKNNIQSVFDTTISTLNNKHTELSFLKINNTWDIFALNAMALKADFELLTEKRKSASLSSTNNIYNKNDIFIEEGAKVEFASLNASNGPVYIGKNAEVMEGALIRGPFALCEDSIVKMGAKIYGPTTIGPKSKVGGEVNNVVLFGNSNKAHEGYMGNAVIGEWCNLGADTNNSNLKNTYEEIKIWSYVERRFVKTGLNFCGLIMGDHSKCGINTMFNTGTVIGVNANIFGPGFQRNFISSFSWGGTSKMEKFDFKRAMKVAEVVMNRRAKKLDKIEKDILEYIFNLTTEDKFI